VKRASLTPNCPSSVQTSSTTARTPINKKSWSRERSFRWFQAGYDFLSKKKREPRAMGLKREGTLNKRGFYNTAFKRRYIELKDGQIHYFKKQGDDQPAGVVRLGADWRGQRAFSNSQNLNIFFANLLYPSHATQIMRVCGEIFVIFARIRIEQPSSFKLQISFLATVFHFIFCKVTRSVYSRVSFILLLFLFFFFLFSFFFFFTKKTFETESIVSI
jgi:hypothetical protein